MRPSDAHCTTKCTMDDLCTSAIFDKETKNCLFFTDSQASSISTVSDDTTVSYFEKVDCDWTEVTTEVNMIILHSHIIRQNRGRGIFIMYECTFLMENEI